jgi:hypothetical protein
MTKIVLKFILLAICLQGAGDWKQISPLHSTREEVERVLGPPTSACTELCFYDSRNEGIFVHYSRNPCDDPEQPWKVPANTVLVVTVNLAKRPKLSTFKLSREFRRVNDPELNGYSRYENLEKGLSYAVSADGRVYSIDKSPTKNDENRFRCR